jgi:2-iminobutanoate/2-iminopropanoate deaminase
MPKSSVKTDQAPGAAGPYSQAIVANRFVFTAGQVAIVPDTGKLAEGGVQEQTRQVLSNVKAILEAAGSSLNSVVKTTVFLQNIEDFQAMNAVYATFFAGDPPARSTVAVRDLPLKGALVEIETIALLEK